jgi:hypothetical protein
MDVVGRSHSSTVKFSPGSVHPTPYFRVLINLILLRRMGFEQIADNLKRVWLRLYPSITPADIPPHVMKSFYPAAEMVVDTMVFQPYKQFGDKSLAKAVKFGPAQMAMIEQAAQLLSAGKDPGVIPVRFMIGAARFALDQRLAPPQNITENFYRILGRR